LARPDLSAVGIALVSAATLSGGCVDDCVPSCSTADVIIHPADSGRGDYRYDVTLELSNGETVELHVDCVEGPADDFVSTPRGLQLQLICSSDPALTIGVPWPVRATRVEGVVRDGGEEIRFAGVPEYVPLDSGNVCHPGRCQGATIPFPHHGNGSRNEDGGLSD
jgi:hypothetical protein